MMVNRKNRPSAFVKNPDILAAITPLRPFHAALSTAPLSKF
ncbi:MAG: hypothetical protein ACKOUM_09530 [Sphingopyxis sp.]